MTNPMGDRFKNVTEAEVNALARHCDKRIEWRKKNGITDETINRIVCNRDRRAAISTVRAVQILLSYGHELEVEYDGYSGLVYPYMTYYYVALEKDGKKYIYTTSDLDDFGKNAKFGPYSLKDVVDKWDVHFAQIDVRQWNGTADRKSAPSYEPGAPHTTYPRRKRPGRLYST